MLLFCSVLFCSVQRGKGLQGDKKEQIKNETSPSRQRVRFHYLDKWIIGMYLLQPPGGGVGLRKGKQQGIVVTTNAVCTNLRTEAEPQQIVAQRLLSCLQYPVPVKSSTEDLTRPPFCFAVK